MSGIQYSGFQDLSGRTFGTLQVGQIARRTPALAWRYRCNRCGTEGVLPHTAFVNGSARCGNSGCGRSVSNPSRTAAIIAPVPATRSADSASAREFARSQKTSVTFDGEPSAQGILNADTRSVGLYLDSVKEQKERRQ